MLEQPITTNNEAVDTTPRTWVHSRKGKIVGYVTGTSKDSEWVDITLTEDNYWGYAGEILTSRKVFLSEVK